MDLAVLIDACDRYLVALRLLVLPHIVSPVFK